MTEQTYQGSCHCGAIAYEADLDLSQGTARCNCTFCARVRNWSAATTPEKFRLIRGADRVAAYGQDLRACAHLFCPLCGVRIGSRGDMPEVGGPFASVMVSTLQVSPAELLAGPITYQDGLHDNWMEPPAETRHL